MKRQLFSRLSAIRNELQVTRSKDRAERLQNLTSTQDQLDAIEQEIAFLDCVSDIYVTTPEDSEVLNLFYRLNRNELYYN